MNTEILTKILIVMRYLIINSLILLLAGLILFNCKPTENHIRYDADLNLIEWNLPNEAKVSTPFAINLKANLESTCIKSLHFAIAKNATSDYYLWAKGLYDNEGQDCLPLTQYVDSLRMLTINQTGKLYFYFLKSNVWKKDSINIIP